MDALDKVAKAWRRLDIPHNSFAVVPHPSKGAVILKIWWNGSTDPNLDSPSEIDIPRAVAFSRKETEEYLRHYLTNYVIPKQGSIGCNAATRDATSREQIAGLVKLVFGTEQVRVSMLLKGLRGEYYEVFINRVLTLNIYPDMLDDVQELVRYLTRKRDYATAQKTRDARFSAPQHWLDRELDIAVSEFPENVEKRVRDAGFIIPKEGTAAMDSSGPETEKTQGDTFNIYRDTELAKLPGPDDAKAVGIPNYHDMWPKREAMEVALKMAAYSPTSPGQLVSNAMQFESYLSGDTQTPRAEGHYLAEDYTAGYKAGFNQALQEAMAKVLDKHLPVQQTADLLDRIVKLTRE